MYEESIDKKLVRLPFNQYAGLFEIQTGTIEMINYFGLWRCMYVWTLISVIILGSLLNTT